MTHSTSSAGREFVTGMRDTLPLILGAIPFGIIFGALAITAGLSVAATMGLSLIVFAGSSQFIAATLVSQSTGVGIIVLTTLIVNLRHGLYAASLGPYLQQLPMRWLACLAFWLTDETYAVAIQRFQRQHNPDHRMWYYLGSALLMYGNWQLCTLLGILAGNNLSGIKDWGLEIAMLVTFIGIVVPLLRSRSMIVCALVAAVVSTLCHDLPNQMGLILASVIAIASGFIIETRSTRVAEDTAESESNKN